MSKVPWLWSMTQTAFLTEKLIIRKIVCHVCLCTLWNFECTYCLGFNFSVILLHFDAQSSMMFKKYSWLENSSCLCLPKQLLVIFSAFRCPKSHDWISQGFENSNVTKMKNVQLCQPFKNKNDFFEIGVIQAATMYPNLLTQFFLWLCLKAKPKFE